LITTNYIGALETNTSGGKTYRLCTSLVNTKKLGMLRSSILYYTPALLKRRTQ